MDSSRANRLDQLRAHHQQIIETGWTYSPAASASVPPAPVQSTQESPAPAASATNFYCLTPASAQRVIYYSAFAPTIPAVTKGDLERSFAAYLESNYGYKTSTSCQNPLAPSEARFRTYQIDGYRSSGYTILETDWTYTPVTSARTSPSPAAPTPSSAAPVAATPVPQKPTAPIPPKPTPPSATTHSTAAAAAPAPQTPYAFCWGGSTGPPPRAAYFGDPFAAPAQNVPAWSAAYKELLRNEYKFAGLIHCGTRKSLALAQQHMQQEKDQMRAHWKIVETGWKYQ
jgi:hypothetical protein